MQREINVKYLYVQSSLNKDVEIKTKKTQRLRKNVLPNRSCRDVSQKISAVFCYYYIFIDFFFVHLST